MNTSTASHNDGQHVGVRKVRIDSEMADQRIDNLLRRELPGVPKSRVYRILRRGEVRVNGGRVKAEYRLVEGDEVRIPPIRIDSAPAAPPSGLSEALEKQVLFEDKRVLVINKPSGLAVHGGSGISFGAIELLRAARPECPELSLAHRLDRETSGCLVLTKKRSALRELHERFRKGTVEKNYMALVSGDWQLGDEYVDAPLLVQNRKNGERHVIVDSSGKLARTSMRLSRTFGQFSLMQCQPKTGRTHQIRVHALHTGHPIVGDERYGMPETNALAKKLGLKRLFLHAQSIAFPDDSGNELHFTAPLPDDLDRFLDRIRGGGRRRNRP